MTSYKTPLLPPTREILNVGKIYKVAQFCTDLSKGQKEPITGGFRPPVIVDHQIEKRRGGYTRVKPLFFMTLSKPFRQLA
jgi:hypothetical protein